MKWRCSVKSSKAELLKARSCALEVLQQWGIPSSLHFDFDLILCELLANAAAHGNHWEPEKKVYLSMQWKPSRHTVLIFVADEGRQPICEDVETVPCSESGRGLAILTELADRCRFGSGRVWIRKGVRHGEENPGSGR
ncbi:MAG TPA: ATP-binding protein [Clostridia bacterium]|nr:ATP-binding protein [Clostridia bacterium]